MEWDVAKETIRTHIKSYLTDEDWAEMSDCIESVDSALKLPLDRNGYTQWYELMTPQWEGLTYDVELYTGYDGNDKGYWRASHVLARANKDTLAYAICCAWLAWQVEITEGAQS